MARGRMLNKKISMNKALAELEKEEGPYSVIVLTWLIAHLDVEGRFTGEPVLIKGVVCPWLDGCTVGLIEKTLARADRLGIIRWYEVEGNRWLQYVNFARNQIGLRKDREAESEVPPPPNDTEPRTGAVQEKSPTKRNIRIKVKKDRKRNGAGLMDAKSTDIERVVAHYRASHKKRGLHIKAGHSDWNIIKARLKEGFTVEQLCHAIDGNKIDTWHSERRAHSITMIFRNAGKVEDFVSTAIKGPPRQFKNSLGGSNPPQRLLSEWMNEGEEVNN